MSQNLPIGISLSPNENLSDYMQAVNAAPILSAEEEYALAMRHYESDDLEAARQLIMSHLRYVVKVARGFMGYGLPLTDLIQEGSIGLMKAVKRFDPSRDVRLVSFAVHWIRAEIYDYVLRNWRMVKVATTKTQKKLFFNLRKSKKRLGWMNQAEVNQLADDLGVASESVREMELRLSGADVAFDAQPDKDEDDNGGNFSPSQYLADNNYNPEKLVSDNQQAGLQKQQLSLALAELDQRSLDIVQRRWLSAEKETLNTLAEEYGVSVERVRQIEKSALQKMKKAIVVATPSEASELNL